MRNSKRSKAGTGLAGAVVVAGATQAYAAIVSVTPPAKIIGPSNTSTTEYWSAATGITSTTSGSTTTESFRVRNTNIVYNGSPDNTLETSIGNVNGSTTLGTSGNYGQATNVPFGGTIGTGGKYSVFNSGFALVSLSYNFNGSDYGIPSGTKAYVGFQFKAADGLLHDGYFQLESDPYVSASDPGGLTFFAADYNSVPDSQGGYIAAGASAPEPGSLSMLALGAIAMFGVGRGRRCNAGL